MAKIKEFAGKVHAGAINGAGGEFKKFLLIGIGGSALGPQFVAQALGNPRKDKLKPYFFDNTDPDGMNRTLAAIGHDLNRTLCIVISKSGGTKETRNGMFVAQAAYEKAGLQFRPARGRRHHGRAANSTNTPSPINGWNASPCGIGWAAAPVNFRPVGLAAGGLQGIDIDGLLAGGQKADAAYSQT